MSNSPSRRSYRDEAQGVKWTCDGSPAYEISDFPEKTDRGTDIVLCTVAACWTAALFLHFILN